MTYRAMPLPPYFTISTTSTFEVHKNRSACNSQVGVTFPLPLYIRYRELGSESGQSLLFSFHRLINLPNLHSEMCMDVSRAPQRSSILNKSGKRYGIQVMRIMVW